MENREKLDDLARYLYEKETAIQNQLKQAQDAFYCKKMG